MSRRYVDTKGKPFTTKLDTNFLEDFRSKPICMNYTMNRLMEIAIHNDTSFLHKYEKIDYSFLVWIDHERKLIRVGIIDYIQNFSFEK
jgi:1-phosphatidylinositol-3-phosphate 5-kinase